MLTSDSTNSLVSISYFIFPKSLIECMFPSERSMIKALSRTVTYIRFVLISLNNWLDCCCFLLLRDRWVDTGATESLMSFVISPAKTN